MKPPSYPASPPASRSRFSRGVRGQPHRQSSSAAPQAAAGRWTQASRVIPPYDPLDPFAVPPPPINEAFTVSIDWQVPNDVEPGTHRLLFRGSEKGSESEAQAFAAETPSFEVVAKQ